MERIPVFFQSRTKWATTLLIVLTLFCIVTLVSPQFASAKTNSDTPGRVVQVVLEQQPKISQFTDIDSSENALGPNGCGFVAAAAALGGTDWTSLVNELAQAAGTNYNPDAGIQPSNYVVALQKVFGSDNVTAQNSTSLQDLYQELETGNIVIVDIQVNADNEIPSATAPTYAHFARVLGMDMNRQEVYIENTLEGGAYWTVSFQDFQQAWQEPETNSTMIPDPQHAEDVTDWMVILNSTSNAY